MAKAAKPGTPDETIIWTHLGNLAQKDGAASATAYFVYRTCRESHRAQQYCKDAHSGPRGVHRLGREQVYKLAVPHPTGGDTGPAASASGRGRAQSGRWTAPGQTGRSGSQSSRCPGSQPACTASLGMTEGVGGPAKQWSTGQARARRVLVQASCGGMPLLPDLGSFHSMTRDSRC